MHNNHFPFLVIIIYIYIYIQDAKSTILFPHVDLQQRETLQFALKQIFDNKILFGWLGGGRGKGAAEDKDRNGNSNSK